MEGQEHWDNVTVSPKGTVTIKLRACLHRGGGLQVGEVTRLSLFSLIWSPHLLCKSDQIKVFRYSFSEAIPIFFNREVIC